MARADDTHLLYSQQLSPRVHGFCSEEWLIINHNSEYEVLIGENQ